MSTTTSESDTNNGATITVTVKAVNGTTFTAEVSPDSTVEDFKKILEQKCNIPYQQQRLIYSGHVLKDPSTVGSYGKYSLIFFFYSFQQESIYYDYWCNCLHFSWFIDAF